MLVFHKFCIIIFAFAVTGSMNLKGSSSLEDTLSTDFLVNLSVLLTSPHSFVNESDGVSVSVFQTSPKTLIVNAALIPSDPACLFNMVELLVHRCKFILALSK